MVTDRVSLLLQGRPVDPLQAFQRAAAFYAQGRLREAEQLYDVVLAADPRHFESVYCLGLIRLQQDRFADAELLFRRAVKIEKRSADAHHHLAIALTGLQRLDEAIPRYEKALALRPKYAEAHNNLGHALQILERHAEAARHYENALAINPSYAEAHNNLGNALQALEQNEEAVRHYQQALAINPTYAEAHNNLASALTALKRYEDAIPHCEQALALRPNNLEARINLANALAALGNEQAIMHYQKALAIDPTNVDVYQRLGSLLLSLGRMEEAIPHYEQALAVKPDLVVAYNGLGAALQALGRLNEAIHAFEKAIAVSPRTGAGYLNLAMATRLGADDTRFAAMRELSRDMESLDVEDQIRLHFALGKVFGDLGDHEQSFQHLLHGNQLKRQQLDYDEAKRLARSDQIRAAFSAELLRDRRGLGDPSCVPVFVVGMPRSGTTLIEQILASHSKVSGAGELEEFGRAVFSIGQASGASVTYPEIVSTLSAEQLRQVGASYLQVLGATAGPAERIVDKLPLNFTLVGLIHLALPNARIIWARRDPIDTCVSCFSAPFGGYQPHTYDLGELGRYHRAYEALMDHWQKVLPEGVLLEVRYEDVVDDLENQARRMVGHCDLEWEEACLAFHKTQRSVRTASVAQVRKPIYRSSVGRWRPYKHLLQPLFQALGVDSGFAEAGSLDKF
jgi:tetratricopeptide (TPR) repeat protein